MSKTFKSLGNKNIQVPTEPSKDILESFNNEHRDALYLVPLFCNEFTCLGPVNGQPDFASLEIVYAPRVKMVESKSLKLYFYSFRNHEEFHEDVTNRIFKDLWNLMDPHFMRIIANFNIRGGIAIRPLVQKFSNNIKPAQKQQLLEMLESWDRNK